MLHLLQGGVLQLVLLSGLRQRPLLLGPVLQLHC
jgi:hypothetical protein